MKGYQVFLREVIPAGKINTNEVDISTQRPNFYRFYFAIHIYLEKFYARYTEGSRWLFEAIRGPGDRRFACRSRGHYHGKARGKTSPGDWGETLPALRGVELDDGTVEDWS